MTKLRYIGLVIVAMGLASCDLYWGPPRVHPTPCEGCPPVDELDAGSAPDAVPSPDAVTVDAAPADTALPPACAQINTEAACAARSDCEVVSEGVDCTTPNGTACQVGETNCTCASYVFESCASRPTGT